MSYYKYNFIQFDATLSDNICGQKCWSFLTIEFGRQKYTFCTLLTTTVLTFGQNDSFPLYFKSKCHIII